MPSHDGVANDRLAPVQPERIGCSILPDEGFAGGRAAQPAIPVMGTGVTAVDWDKIRIFLNVAEAGSFTRAGDDIGLSQSAVSRQISALERELKAPLFHRHARGLILTEQGDLLFRAARDMKLRLENTKARLVETSERPSGDLRVTTTVGLGTSWLSQRITEFLVGEDHLDAHVRVEIEEFGDALGEPRGAEAHRRRHLEVAGGAFARLHEAGAGVLQPLFHVAGGPEQEIALLRENEPAGVAMEQGGLQLAIEGADLAAHGRLAQADIVTGPREAARLRDVEEDADLVPVQGVHSRTHPERIPRGHRRPGIRHAGHGTRDHGVAVSTAHARSADDPCRQRSR